MENNAKDSIPAPVRKVIYWAFFVVAIVIGSFQAFIATTGGVQPEWVTGALAVVAYASGALGLQAAVYAPSKGVSTVSDESAPVESAEIVSPSSEEVLASMGKRFANSVDMPDVPSSLK